MARYALAEQVGKVGGLSAGSGSGVTATVEGHAHMVSRDLGASGDAPGGSLARAGAQGIRTLRTARARRAEGRGGARSGLFVVRRK